MPNTEEMNHWELNSGVEWLRSIGLKPGMGIADFGCRVGHYAIPAAISVGDDGEVFAIDKNPESLEILRQRLHELDIHNARIIQTDGGLDLPLSPKCVDVFLAYDILHSFDKNERRQIYDQVAEIIKDDGIFSVHPRHTRDDSPAHHFDTLRRIDVRDEILSAGWILDSSHEAMISHDEEILMSEIFNFRCGE